MRSPAEDQRAAEEPQEPAAANPLSLAKGEAALSARACHAVTSCCRRAAAGQTSPNAAKVLSAGRSRRTWPSAVPVPPRRSCGWRPVRSHGSSCGGLVSGAVGSTATAAGCGLDCADDCHARPHRGLSGATA